MPTSDADEAVANASLFGPGLHSIYYSSPMTRFKRKCRYIKTGKNFSFLLSGNSDAQTKRNKIRHTSHKTYIYTVLIVLKKEKEKKKKMKLNTQI